MRSIVVAVFLTLVLPSRTFSQSIDLTVMSFNIQQPYGNNWDERKDSAVAVLRSQNPDIVGTQEAIASQRKYLLDSTSGYLYYGLGRDGGDNGEGSWVFYKEDKYTLDSAYSGNFWLSDTPESPSRFGGDYNRICTYVRLMDNASGEYFYIYNAHFPTPDLQTARAKSMGLLAERAALRAHKYNPVILTGDFNSSENNAVTKWMKSGDDNPLQCRDTYRDAYPTGEVTTGFGTKYDYVYVPNRSRYVVNDSWVVEQPSKASDHMPIVASISIMYAQSGLQLPTADAGDDQFVQLGSTESVDTIIVLDASYSFSIDGLIASYQWMANDTVFSNEATGSFVLPIGNHAFYLLVTDTSGAVSEDQLIVVVKEKKEEEASLLPEVLKSKIRVYPIPIRNSINIDSEYGDVQKIRVFNMSGQVMAQSIGAAILDVQNVPTGMYVLEVMIDDELYLQNVLKN